VWGSGVAIVAMQHGACCSGQGTSYELATVHI
jgi:hypothetical protein